MEAEVAEVLVLRAFYTVSEFILLIKSVPTVQQSSNIYVHRVMTIDQRVLVD